MPRHSGAANGAEAGVAMVNLGARWRLAPTNEGNKEIARRHWLGNSGARKIDSAPGQWAKAPPDASSANARKRLTVT